jgi:predicted membrane channel-forming protein YqfA (hemolysin III family)
MRAPLTLIIPAGVFGVVMSAASSGLAAQIDRPIAAVLFVVAIWVMIPVVATVIAYKQGFDRGLSVGRKTEVPEWQ